MRCPECNRQAEFVTQCDFCGNNYCHACEPALRSSMERLCSSCVSLQRNVRTGEKANTNKLRVSQKRLKLPRLVNGVPPSVPKNLTFDLLYVTTKLVNRAAKNRVTPGTSKIVDKLWAEARRTLLLIGKSLT